MPLREGSLADRIAALDAGETLSVSVRIPFGASVSAKPSVAGQVYGTRQRLKNKMRPILVRAKKASGGDFVGELVTAINNDGNAFIVSYAITRLSRKAARR